MSTTHTPGPWVMHPTTLHPAVRSVGTADTRPRRICTVGTMNGNPADQANARLICEAPEMLKLLQELQQSASYWSEYDVPLGIVDRINTAIARATGETA